MVVYYGFESRGKVRLLTEFEVCYQGLDERISGLWGCYEDMELF